MAKLHLGVVDLPYSYGSQRTTYEVANILEGKYAVMETFARDNDKEIRQILQDQAARYAAQTMRGQEPNLQPAFEKIRRLFKSYILARRLDGRGGRFPIPTAASLRGVNHRMRHPYARRAPRASLWDTGLYVTAFKTWVEK